MYQSFKEHSNLDPSVPGFASTKLHQIINGFASTKLHQIINEGKEKTNEKPSLSSNNEGNE